VLEEEEECEQDLFVFNEYGPSIVLREEEEEC